MNNTSNRHLLFPRLASRMALGVFLLAPALAWSADWNAGTGAFGNASNWTPNGVPSGITANIINGGTAQVSSGDSFGVGVLRAGNSSGSGSISQSGGSITTTQLMLGDGAGTGTLTMTGGSLTGTGGTEMWIGNNGGTGIANLTNSSLANNSWIILARLGANTVGQITLNGTSSLTKTGGSDRHIGIGLISNQNNFVTLNDSSTMTSNSDVWVGWAGKGTVTLNNSSLVTIGNNLVIGKEKGNGLVSANGNSVLSTGGSILVGADNGAGTGTPLGTLEVHDDATVTAGKILHVGFGGMSGVVTMTGGTLKALPFPDYVAGRSASVTLGYNGGVAATLNLNGGTLETTGFYKGGGTASIKLNGTLIKATGTPTGGATFFEGVASSDIDVQAGGAKFDTNGNDITISQNLSGVGGLAKLGAGTLTLTGANAFTGVTSITGGALKLGASERIADVSAVTLAGGTLNLNNFNETLAALTLGSSSTIDFGGVTGGNSVAFANSSAIGWTGILTLANFELGSDNISFSAAGLTAQQLAKIQFTIGDTLYQGIGFDGNNVTFQAVPEPADYGIVMALMMGAVAMQRIRARRQAS